MPDDNSQGALDSYGGSGGGFGGGDPTAGGGSGLGVGAALDVGNMATTGADLGITGAMALGGVAGIAAIQGANGTATGLGVASIGVGSYGGPIGTALADLAHDASIGLGVGVTANPGGFSMFGADMSPVDVSGAPSGGGIAYAVNLGGSMAQYDTAGNLVGVVPDLSFNTGGGGSQ